MGNIDLKIIQKYSNDIGEFLLLNQLNSVEFKLIRNVEEELDVEIIVKK